MNICWNYGFKVDTQKFVMLIYGANDIAGTISRLKTLLLIKLYFKYIFLYLQKVLSFPTQHTFQ